MPSSSGYTDPGDGRHQPMLAFSTPFIMSAPFLGPVSSIENIHGRSQPLLFIPNISYRLFDIEYPIKRFKPYAKETVLLLAAARRIEPASHCMVWQVFRIVFWASKDCQGEIYS